MFERAGTLTMAFLTTTGEFAGFAARAAREVILPPFEFKETIRQLYELGVRSAPLIAVSGLAVGVVIGPDGYRAPPDRVAGARQGLRTASTDS